MISTFSHLQHLAWTKLIMGGSFSIGEAKDLDFGWGENSLHKLSPGV
jgi:hypothetical protein